MISLIVNEIFNSIEGEGKRAGQLASFIRLTGCNLRCSYCDTQYAYNEGEEMPVRDILDRLRYTNVVLTGGEPLMQNVFPLLEELDDQGYLTNIETNGSVNLAPYRMYHNVFFSMDYKCNGSGENIEMLEENLDLLRPFDVLKFIVTDETDLRQAMVIKRTQAQVYVSPAYGLMNPQKIVDFMRNNGLVHWRLNLQLHKVIWGENARGV